MPQKVFLEPEAKSSALTSTVWLTTTYWGNHYIAHLTTDLSAAAARLSSMLSTRLQIFSLNATSYHRWRDHLLYCSSWYNHYICNKNNDPIVFALHEYVPIKGLLSSPTQINIIFESAWGTIWWSISALGICWPLHTQNLGIKSLFFNRRYSHPIIYCQGGRFEACFADS